MLDGMPQPVQLHRMDPADESELHRGYGSCQRSGPLGDPKLFLELFREGRFTCIGSVKAL